MNVPPVSVERVQKCVVNFEVYRFLKKAANLPHPPLPLEVVVVMGQELYPLSTKVLIVLCQSEPVVRQSVVATRETSAVGNE